MQMTWEQVLKGISANTLGLNNKYEGFFENALTFDVKFSYNLQNCF